MDEGTYLVVEYVNGDAHWSTKPNLARFAESSPKQCRQERNTAQKTSPHAKSACFGRATQAY
jgi:hypothetical protein